MGLIGRFHIEMTPNNFIQEQQSVEKHYNRLPGPKHPLSHLQRRGSDLYNSTFTQGNLKEKKKARSHLLQALATALNQPKEL